MLSSIASAVEADGADVPRVRFYSSAHTLLLNVPLSQNVFQGASQDLVRSNLNIAGEVAAVATGDIAYFKVFDADDAQQLRANVSAATSPVTHVVSGRLYSLSVLSVRMTDTGALDTYCFLLPSMDPDAP
jgi:hypothetical protein